MVCFGIDRDQYRPLAGILLAALVARLIVALASITIRAARRRYCALLCISRHLVVLTDCHVITGMLDLL
jgi:hypothetical protein